MKKKILIGSLIAVALLTLVSFSSVVGYNSVESDSKIASPLFGIRTNRAINKEQDVITSDYIGKGKATNILLPRMKDKTELVEKFVNFIRDMDEQSLDNFANKISIKLESDDMYSDVKRSDVKEAVYFISENPELSKGFLLQDNEKNGTKDFTGNYRPLGCIFQYVVIGVIFIIGLIFLILMSPILIFRIIFSITCSGECCGFTQTLKV